MSDITLDWIWSEYTTSPDRAAGMQCLQQTCSALYKHVLLPTHIVLSGGGFSLHPDLAQLLTNVVPPLGRLLNLALRSVGLPGAQFFCQTELHGLTCTTGLDIATQNQVVWNWIHLIDKVYIAMVDLKSLRYGRPLYILGHERPSRMRETLASLPLPLLVKLPADFLRSYGISIAKARDAVRRMAQECERGSTHSRTRSPQQDSHTRQNHAEAGGPASPQATAADGSVKSVSPAAMGKAAADTPRIRSSPCGGTTALATPPLHTSDLVTEYTAGPDSVYQRAKDVVSKNTLDGKDIVDHGDCNGSPHFGQFGLEPGLFVRVDKTVIEIQSLLIKASSLAGKASHFIVDPHRTAITTLRGAGNVEQLPCAWDCLVERLRIAQDILERYLSGRLNDPERQACDAAAHRRVMHWAACEDIAQRARRAAGARTQGEPPNLAQAATVAVSPPERSPPLSAVGTPNAAEPQPPSHPMEDGIRMNESIETTGHAPGHTPAAATPAAVKDPPCDSLCDLLLHSTHKSGAPVASSPASTTSVPLGASVPVPSELSAVLADTGLQKLVPARSQNIRTEDELGGRVRQQSCKKSISLATHSVIHQPSASVPVRTVGACATDLGGQKNSSSRANQLNSNSDGEGRTVRMLEKTNSCEVKAPSHFCPDAVRSLELTRPAHAHLDAAFAHAPRPVTTMVSSASIAAASLSAAATSMSLGVSALPCTGAPTMGAAQLPAQKVTLTQSHSLKTEADLGGQLEQRSGKKSILSRDYSVLPLSPAPVFAVGAYAVERGGLEYVVSRANQQSPNKKKEAGRTFEELARASVSPLSILLTFTSLNSPSYSFGSLSRALSDLSFVTASLVIALVSAIVRTGTITHLEHLEVSDAAPYRLWEREGVGTCALN